MAAGGSQAHGGKSLQRITKRRRKYFASHKHPTPAEHFANTLTDTAAHETFSRRRQPRPAGMPPAGTPPLSRRVIIIIQQQRFQKINRQLVRLHFSFRHNPLSDLIRELMIMLLIHRIDNTLKRIDIAIA